VGNGDMTLICLGDKAGTTILIDCNIRAAADDPENDTRDVGRDLRDRLKRDSKGRPFVDAFLTTHPDADHCRGVEKHFHLGPMKNYPDDKKPDKEKKIGKNHSSVVLNIELADASERNTVKNFLIGGDAEVLIWEKLWDKHKKKPEVLAYDSMLTPHHCSWHTLSHDSRTELGDKAKVSADAKSALSQIRQGGYIISSSCPIKDDDCEPPCYAAKLEYQSIVKG